MISIVYSDGGRKAAGFHSKYAEDCVTRAICLATGMDYREVYDSLIELAKLERPRKGKSRSHPNRGGVYKPTINRFMAKIGWSWTPTMQIGSGCKVHLRADELPGGTIIVSLSQHVAAVIDGVLHDSHDSSRGGTRCVYGYWHV